MEVLYCIAFNQSEKRQVIREVADKLDKLGTFIERVDYIRGCIYIERTYRVWIITENEYYLWSKGRTYYFYRNEAIYHSGYEIKKLKKGADNGRNVKKA